MALSMTAAAVCPACAAQAESVPAVSGSADVYETIGLSSYHYYVMVNGDIEITGFNGFAQELTVPSVIDGHKVSAIASLSLPDGVLSLTVPGSVKRVDRIGGSSLCKVTFSEGVEEIGEYAFGYRTDGFMPTATNTSLTEVKLPTTLKKIGKGAFEGCSSLQKVNFPKGCEIGERAFYQCVSLICPDDDIFSSAGALAFADTQGYYDYNKVRVENNCYIRGTRLINCESKDRVLEIPEGVEYLDFTFADTKNNSTPGYYFQELVRPSTIKTVTGFDDCQELVKVTFKGVPEVIDSFNNCPRLSDIKFPEGTKKITGFSKCPSLTSVDIPSSVETLGGFYRNDALQSVTFHDGSLKVIQEDSFSRCGKLNNVFLPSPLEEIGTNAFTECPVLKNLNFPKTVCRVFTDLENEPWYYEQPLGEPLYIGSCYMGFPYDYYEEYPETVKLRAGTLGISVKYGPTKYELPSTLKYIGQISDLEVEDLVIPEGVEYIDSGAVYGNKSVKTITIPKSVKYIGGDAFGGCPELVKVTFKGNTETVDRDIFSYDSKLKTIELPDGFDAFIFAECGDGYYETYPIGYSAEKWIVTKDKEYKGDSEIGVEYISVSGDELESITIPENVQRVRISAPNLKSLKLPNTVRELEIDSATKLTTLDLPKGLEKLRIGSSSTLKTINAPDSLLFAYCSEDSAWFKAQPDGPVYIGKCLVGYKGEMPSGYKLVVPEGVRSVCGLPSNDKLTELVLPSTCRIVEDCDYCKALTKLDLGGTVYVAGSAFNRSPITELELGDACRYIGREAFLYTTLDTISFPDSMEYVAPGNFDVKKAYLSKNMHSAENYSDLDGTVYTTGVKGLEAWGHIFTLFNMNDDDAPVLIGYKDTAYEKYAEAMSHLGYTFIDAENGDASETSGYTFDESTGTLKITTDEGMAEWSAKYRSKTDTAYSGGTVVKPTFPDKLAKVKKVIIGEQVTVIPAYAFSYCTSLQSITIPPNITRVEEGAFSSCTSLKDVTIERDNSGENGSSQLLFFPVTGGMLENNGYEATFTDCPALEKLTIPEGSGIPCVWNCPNFKEITIQYKCGEQEKGESETYLDEKQFMNVSEELAILVPEEYEDIWKAEYPYYEDIINPGSKVYRLSVNGMRFSSSRLSIPCGDGTAEFDPKTNTLTLKNATITKSSTDFYRNFTKTENGVWDSPNAGIKSALSSLDLVLEGENKLLGAEAVDGIFQEDYPGYILHGIQTTGDLKIHGSGSLTVRSMYYTGIDCGGNLTIDSVPISCVYVSENFEGGSRSTGFMDASNIEINNCDLTGFYLWSKNEIKLTNTKLDTNGQSLIFGNMLRAKSCYITVVNEYAANGGAFILNSDDRNTATNEIHMTMEDTRVHVSVPGMVTNLYRSEIQLNGSYGITSGDWDDRNIEIGPIVAATDPQTGIQAINIGDYSFTVREVTLENDYNGLYSDMYHNAQNGGLLLFSGDRARYKLLSAYKLTLKKGDSEVESGEPFTFNIPLPDTPAMADELVVYGYGFEGDSTYGEYTHDGLTEINAVIRDGCAVITTNNYNNGIFAIAAPMWYYIPKPPISGTVTGGKTGSTIKVSLFDVKENWEVSNTYTTSDPFDFEFKNTSPGTYLLRAEEEGHTTYERTVTVTEDSYIVLNITLNPLGEASTCEVVASDEPISSDGTYGDLDRDGQITANDALAILRSSVGMSELSPEQTVAADVDGDGNITANDALAVLRSSVGMGGDDRIGKPIV